jgi:protein-tyrosine phosphatase
VPELPEVMAEVGPELIRYPVRDPRIPTDGAAFRTALQDLLRRVQRGQFIAIACRGGIDRSGMAAGCLLREAGLEADDAIDRVHAARKGSLTLGEQLDYVRAWPPRVDP